MICLVDPALQDHDGTPSTNLGDVVIYRAISRCLTALWPGEEVCRISSHEPLQEHHYEILEAARIVFLGGSNLLSSDVLTYNQWNFANGKADYGTPRIKEAVLLGIGWWQYQDPPNAFTSEFYQRILCRQRMHSVRDRYTAGQLREAGISNVVATGCPAMWGLDGVSSHRTDRWTDDCLVMLTDYYTHPAHDDEFLRIVADHFPGKLYFFPQGTGDVAYLKSLPVFEAVPARFEILEHSLDSLSTFLRANRVTYVGTRLHGGITTLAHRVPSLILGVDNRATEMSVSFNLPVVKRGDSDNLRRWLRGHQMFEPVSVPTLDIAKWWQQFEPQASLANLLQQMEPTVEVDSTLNQLASKLRGVAYRLTN